MERDAEPNVPEKRTCVTAIGDGATGGNMNRFALRLSELFWINDADITLHSVSLLRAEWPNDRVFAPQFACHNRGRRRCRHRSRESRIRAGFFDRLGSRS
ncbi:MAG: hypothetical protein WDM86_00740 [Rhizomicrobium sp.]